MKTIQISTDVFAKIWAHRGPGEETEDEILARLLGAKVLASSQDASQGVQVMAKAIWRDDVRTALEQLNGSAPLDMIYRAVRDIRRRTGRSLPPSTEAIIRRELEYNSSDSESYTGKFDWFRSVDGIGSGVWALRQRHID